MKYLLKYFIICLVLVGFISIGYFVYLRLNAENLKTENMIIDNLTPEKTKSGYFY